MASLVLRLRQGAYVTTAWPSEISRASSGQVPNRAAVLIIATRKAGDVWSHARPGRYQGYRRTIGGSETRVKWMGWNGGACSAADSRSGLRPGADQPPTAGVSENCASGPDDGAETASAPCRR
jgi:hypothetical protein